MGEFRDSANIRCFEPDNDAETCFIRSSTDWISPTLADIIETAKGHFGADVTMDRIHVAAESIQTRCLGHDAYDGADYEGFIVLTLK